MQDYQSLSHSRWDCKYHVVFIPKKRKRRIFGALRQHLGEIFWELAKQKESQIVEGHLMGDHVHMCISIPPKLAVSHVVGFIKGICALSTAFLRATLSVVSLRRLTQTNSVRPSGAG